VSALVLPAAGPARDVFVDYLDDIAGLGIGHTARAVRRRAARRFLDAHPDLVAWTTRPTPARLADLSRSGAWPLLCFLFLTGRLQADADLLAGCHPAGLFEEWAALHPVAMATAEEVAARFDHPRSWVDTARAGLCLVCLLADKEPETLNDDDFDAARAALAATPFATGPWAKGARMRLYAAQTVAFQARWVDEAPRRLPGRALSLAQLCDGVPQPEIRRTVLAYLEALSTTLAPSTVRVRAHDLVTFAAWLGKAHPEVVRLIQLRRQPHLEGFLVWNAARRWRGRVAGTHHQISPHRARSTVLALQGFFTDLALWGWADRPPRPLLTSADAPRRPEGLPRALPPDADRDLMAAVAELDDPFARAALLILRGAGLRISELLDLELDSLIEFGEAGTWLRVPLNKTNRERSVPLDPQTLAAFDEWAAQRGPQWALPHPRYGGRPADFLFVERGQRLTNHRIRKGLRRAVAAAGLAGTDGAPLTVTPHQLRHTYATALVNGGLSLQALMALLGHVSPQMSLRYASLASSTVRAAYEAALGRSRRVLPVLTPGGRPGIPDRVEWLRSEMLKTRVAHGYCAREPVAGACPYANICEQCENFEPAAEFLPTLEAQLADIVSLRDDAAARGWNSEELRHHRVIETLERHLQRLQRLPTSPETLENRRDSRARA
jgi:integrase